MDSCFRSNTAEEVPHGPSQTTAATRGPEAPNPGHGRRCLRTWPPASDEVATPRRTRTLVPAPLLITQQGTPSSPPLAGATQGRVAQPARTHVCRTHEWSMLPTKPCQFRALHIHTEGENGLSQTHNKNDTFAWTPNKVSGKSSRN